MALLAVAAAIPACNSDWMEGRNRAAASSRVAPGPGYTADVVAFMRTYLNDPTGVRDAMISEPALRSMEDTERYAACLRYTARKSNGQYGPSKDSLIVFRDGRLDRVIDAAREACKDATYRPFPELERMTR